MSKRTSDFIDLDLLVKKLEEKRASEMPDSFNLDATTQAIFSLIAAAFEFRNEIPNEEKQKIVRKGIFNATKKGTLTAKSIKGEILKEKNLYASKSQNKYILVTKISTPYFDSLNRTKIADETIKFSHNLPSKFNRKEVFEIAERMYEINEDIFSIAWTYVRVFVKARSEHEAFLKALDSLDFLRGIWNLYFNRSKGMRISSGRRKVVNEITLGQIHTLHCINGKLATSDFWYEPEFIHSISNFSIERDWDNLKNFERYVKKQISRSNYKEEITQALLKYTRALDNNNLNNAFLALWTLLENLTVSIASYDDAIKRTLFIFREKELQKQKLENLRFYRNQTIHAGYLETDYELETLLFQLKQYVEALIWFHISEGHIFNSISESADFLSLPSEISTLREKVNSKKEEIKLINKAIKYLQS